MNILNILWADLKFFNDNWVSDFTELESLRSQRLAPAMNTALVYIVQMTWTVLSWIRVFWHSKERKEKVKNTLKACLPLLLDIIQSDSTAVYLIGWFSKHVILI